MKKHYFVSFFYFNNQKQFSGFGNREITLDSNENIYSTEKIREIEKEITEENNWDGTVLLNIIPLTNSLY